MTDESMNPIPDAPAAPEPTAAPEPPAAPEPVAAPAPEPPPAAPQYAPPAAPPAPGYAPPPPPGGYAAPGYAPQTSPASDKNKMVAGILAILLGAFGIHKFYLGYTKEGVILLAVTIVSFGALAFVTSIVGIVEGVMYLTKTDQDFYATYVAGRKAWF